MYSDIRDLADLKKILSSTSISEVIHHYILTKNPVCFSGKKDLIYDLKKELSKHFEVHIKNIEIVGSAKLGIVLNPNTNRYGKQYDKNSDIDLVIVSTELFDKAWHELLKLDLASKILTVQEKDFLTESYNSIHLGYVSPNRLPRTIQFYKTWWEIFEKLSSQEKYEQRKIRGRLFKNWWFVEKYYSIMLAKLSNR